MFSYNLAAEPDELVVTYSSLQPYNNDIPAIYYERVSTTRKLYLIMFVVHKRRGKYYEQMLFIPGNPYVELAVLSEKSFQLHDERNDTWKFVDEPWTSFTVQYNNFPGINEPVCVYTKDETVKVVG